MQDAGFEQYNSNKYPTHIDWEKHILETLPTKLAVKTLFAAPVLEFLAMYEREGMVPSEELQQELRALPSFEQPEFQDKLYDAQMRLFREIERFQKSQGLRDDPRVVDPWKVLEYLSANNPYFSRWLKFEGERPRRDPEDWEAYAAKDLRASEVPYAISMRELGQMLRNMTSMRRRLSADLATALMHSHELAGEERYWQTVAWIHNAEREALR
jgi:hypothetical protein